MWMCLAPFQRSPTATASCLCWGRSCGDELASGHQAPNLWEIVNTDYLNITLQANYVHGTISLCSMYSTVICMYLQTDDIPTSLQQWDCAIRRLIFNRQVVNNRHDGEDSSQQQQTHFSDGKELHIPVKRELWAMVPLNQYALKEIPFEARNTLWRLHL